MFKVIQKCNIDSNEDYRPMYEICSLTNKYKEAICEMCSRLSKIHQKAIKFAIFSIKWRYNIHISVVGRVDGWSNLAQNYLFKVTNRNTRTRCKIRSKLTIKTSVTKVVQALVQFVKIVRSLFKRYKEDDRKRHKICTKWKLQTIEQCYRIF